VKQCPQHVDDQQKCRPTGGTTHELNYAQAEITLDEPGGPYCPLEHLRSDQTAHGATEYRPSATFRVAPPSGRRKMRSDRAAAECNGEGDNIHCSNPFEKMTANWRAHRRALFATAQQYPPAYGTHLEKKFIF